MIIVSTTLQELESGCGRAVTATGTLLPMPTVIKMASHAYHYLAIFDKDTGRALHLGRTRRIASADQRIVLHARDRGYTRPGCTVAGVHCQVHHAVSDWADDGHTNVDDLTLACPQDNRRVKPGGLAHLKTYGHRCATARLRRSLADRTVVRGVHTGVTPAVRRNMPFGCNSPGGADLKRRQLTTG